MALTILYESPELLVINKPAEAHSVAAKKSSGGRVIETELIEMFANLKKLPEAGLLHRLDFETSGCLAVARTNEALEKWQPAFRTESHVKKIYWAAVEKAPKENSFAFYFSSRYSGSKKSTVETSGKPNEKGECVFKVIEKRAESTILEIEILGPGKRHQIRAGLAKLGSPLIGDKLYGGNPKVPLFLLHAHQLKSNAFDIIAPLPENWKNAK